MSRKNTLERLERAKMRSLEMAEEGRNVEEGIADILHAHAVAGRNHAAAMHHSNINIKDTRRQMEEVFRKDLSDMDQKYQNEAFNGLNDAQKKELLSNAKLKDEVGLQSIGLANMNVRLVREKMGYVASKSAMRTLEALAEQLRERIEGLQNDMRGHGASIEAYEASVKELRHEHDAMMEKLSRWPADQEVSDAIQACLYETDALRQDTAMWEGRREDCRVIQEDVKPIQSLSGASKLKSRVVGGDSVLSTASVSPGKKRARTKYDVALIQELMRSDIFFKDAVEAFLTKFPLTLCGHGVADLDCNVLMWLLKKLHDVWKVERTGVAGSEMLSAGVSIAHGHGDRGLAEASAETMKDEMAFSEDREEAMLDALIEGTLMHDTGGGGETWLKIVGSPARLPPPEADWMSFSPPKEPETTLGVSEVAAKVPQKKQTPKHTNGVPRTRNPKEKPLQGVENVHVPVTNALDNVRPPIARPKVLSKATCEILETQRMLDRLKMSATVMRETQDTLDGNRSVGEVSVGSGSVTPSEMAMRDPMVTKKGLRPSQSMPALRNGGSSRSSALGRSKTDLRCGSSNAVRIASESLLATIASAGIS
jgi:hypothetical protein